MSGSVCPKETREMYIREIKSEKKPRMSAESTEKRTLTYTTSWMKGAGLMMNVQEEGLSKFIDFEYCTNILLPTRSSRRHNSLKMSGA